MAIHFIGITFSIILTLVFLLYGFNQFYLIRAARRYQMPTVDDSSYRPAVSIHLPIYNEKYVVHRLITACTKMAEVYGQDRVSIKVLDDSTDSTVAEIDEVVRELVDSGFHIEVLRREHRSGFKAGALQEALARTTEEFIAIFDADYVPEPDFLVKSIPHFKKDEKIAIVQSRWIYLNRDFNTITKAIAIGIDVHFLIEQPGRAASGCFLNFNGSGGILRRKAILEAGGWQSDTITEDLDLSYRMQLLGYRVIYLKDVVSPGEIPPTLASLMKQQNRWARGSLQTARKLLAAVVLNKKLDLKSRLEGFIHLTGYSVHFLMVFAFLISVLGALYQVNHPLIVGSDNGIASSMLSPVYLKDAQYLIWGTLLPLNLLCTIAPWASAITAITVQKKSIWSNLSSLIVLYFIGFGISISNAREVYKALFTHEQSEFTRTPKYAELDNHHAWQSMTYQVPLDSSWVLELVFVILGFLAIGLSIMFGNYGPLLYLVPSTAAYAYVLWMIVRESRPARRKRV